MDQQERQGWRDLADNSAYWAQRADKDARPADATALREQAKQADRAARTGRRP